MLIITNACILILFALVSEILPQFSWYSIACYIYICFIQIRAFTNKLIYSLFSFLSDLIYHSITMNSVNGIKDSITRDVPNKKQRKVSTQMDSEYSQRSKWLQAAALGPNDGLVSATSLMMGSGFLRREMKKIKRN